MDSIKRAFIPGASRDNSINIGQQHHDQEAGSGRNGGAGAGQRDRDDLRPEDQKELQQLRSTLQNNIQSSRMQHHAFEPLSLPGSQPVSRVSTNSNCCSDFDYLLTNACLTTGTFWLFYTSTQAAAAADARWLGSPISQAISSQLDGAFTTIDAGRHSLARWR